LVVPEYLIQPGLSLQWGTCPAAAGVAGSWPEATAARLTFVITDDIARTHDRMFLNGGRASALDLPPAAHGAFQVTLGLSSDVLRNLFTDERTPGARRLRAFAANDGEAGLNFPLTAAARLAVESIRRCPFAGACRTMALAARGIDLIVEFLTALSADDVPRPPALTRGTGDQICVAAELLAQQLENPPTLAALARHVGLSETTLKRGFHHAFDTTVFGYLRLRRMERAHALLLSGEATVLEAAAFVGYSNPSNFAAAFRRHFGINPKEFQLTVRR
jgi:AraC-like DNA-binding protein